LTFADVRAPTLTIVCEPCGRHGRDHGERLPKSGGLLRAIFEDEGGDGCADSASGDCDCHQPLDDGRARIGDTGFDIRELGVDVGDRASNLFSS